MGVVGAEVSEPQSADQRIVVGIDGSDPSLRALDWAAHQAERTGDTLEAIMTWALPVSYGWAGMLPGDWSPQADAASRLEEIVGRVRQAHPAIEVRSRVKAGHPAPVLIEASRGAALLVVGSRGHGEFAGMLLGSVSQHCVTHAHCPVLVVRDRD